ncbi:Reverse transcriptase [Phytophthora palmivora]|uniref:Reverse transcriptase n=1 Tax=Phytophthora palmivora TaxID=4796 RepID=A0A2P4Y0W0_9STRA|nr:Reverse transcriptase [Phytophthora palmivora]
MQEHDGVYKPVTFTSRTHKPNEINYARDKIDQSVDAPLYIGVVTSFIRIGRKARAMNLTSIELDPRGREMRDRSKYYIRQGSGLDLGFDRSQETTATSDLDATPDERLLVVSFDGSARVKRSGGAYSGIVWNLPEWTVISAASKYKLDLTVNEAEYHGLLLCLDLLSDMDWGRLIICGDSNLVIRQMKGEIVQDPGIDAATTAGSGTADSLVSAVLQREDGIVITTEEERQDLITLNRLDE